MIRLEAQATMTSNDLGEVILTRELEHDGKKILVEIGRPVPFAPEETDCYVPLRIDGLSKEPQVMSAAGIDGVQAILFALAMIGDVLRNEQGVTFLGMEPCFPVTAPVEGEYVATYRQPLHRPR